MHVYVDLTKISFFAYYCQIHILSGGAHWPSG